MRKAQIEMIGLVFVVVILVLGIVLFVRFNAISSGGTGEYTRQAAATQQASAFMTALKETTVPLCGASVERVARACLEDDYYICPLDPCDALQSVFSDIGEQTLTKQGLYYNLSLEGRDVNVTVGCNSSTPTVQLSSALRSEIILSGGRGTGYFRLSVCR